MTSEVEVVAGLDVLDAEAVVDLHLLAGRLDVVEGQQSEDARVADLRAELDGEAVVFCGLGEGVEEVAAAGVDQVHVLVVEHRRAFCLLEVDSVPLSFALQSLGEQLLLSEVVPGHSGLLAVLLVLLLAHARLRQSAVREAELFHLLVEVVLEFRHHLEELVLEVSVSDEFVRTHVHAVEVEVDEVDADSVVEESVSRAATHRPSRMALSPSEICSTEGLSAHLATR